MCRIARIFGPTFATPTLSRSCRTALRCRKPKELSRRAANMSRQVYTDWRKESVPPEIEELRVYLNQLPLPWREKMLPLCERVGQYIRLQNKLLRMAQDTVEQLQLDVKYLIFDVEATRRERDELIREMGIDGFGEAEAE